MSKAIIKDRAAALLALVRKLVETPGITWVDASNAVYAPNGPFWCMFRTQAERVAYGKTKEGRQIDDLIAGLPTPPVRPGPREDWTEHMVPIRKSAKRPQRERARSRSR